MRCWDNVRSNKLRSLDFQTFKSNCQYDSKPLAFLSLFSLSIAYYMSRTEHSLQKAPWGPRRAPTCLLSVPQRGWNAGQWVGRKEGGKNQATLQHCSARKERGFNLMSNK